MADESDEIEQPTPSPSRLYYQAAEEHPDDAEARRTRYLDLMREHGHIVPGKRRDLPCGWPHHEEADRG